MTSPALHTTRTPARPGPVNSALGLLALVAAANIVGPLLPSSEGEIGFGIVSAVIALVAAVGLWSLRRWGFITTLVVASLNLLLAAPAVALGETALVKIAAGLTVLACALIIVLLTRSDARRAYRS